MDNPAFTGAPLTRYMPVTKSDEDRFPPCRAIICVTAGTANLVQPNGTIRENYPLFAGYNPISVIGVLTGGNADGIWQGR